MMLDLSPVWLQNLLKGKDIDAFKEWANAPYRNTNITNWQQAKNLWETN